jgi:cytochrome P450
MPVNPEVPGDFLRADFRDDCAALRRDAPVHEYAPGCYTVARYADVRAVSRDPARFCSTRGVLMHDPLRHGGEIRGSILHMDPPEHGPWRTLTSRRFTPRAVADLEPRVRAVARAVLDAVPAGTPVDFVDAVSAPFPVLVIAELLGIVDADRAQFRRWSDATIASPDQPDADLEAIGELYRYLVGLVRERRRDPGDDLVSVLVTGEIDGEPISTPDAVGYCVALLVAGNETTRHLTSGAAALLAANPEQRSLLVGNPAGLAHAVEEFLRVVTPIQTFGRTATCDTELAGTRIAEGDWVVMLYASANRDETVFGPTADEFDVARSFDSAHLAFGFGEHLCLGAALARLETRLLFEELLARHPSFEVVGEPTWVPSTLVRGMATLPVVL